MPSDERLIPVCNSINSNFRYNLDIENLAEKAKMSVRSLQRIFKNETGITLQKYLQLTRILKSIELIDTRQYTLSEIAYMVGYQSLSAFSLSYFSVMKSKPKIIRN
nr:AraC family transcriptional regulator [Chryseobacterium daeguense]